MKISSAFPSEFLKAADLQGRQVAVVIDHVEMREVGDGEKPVVFFQGKEKGVVLNKTNANTIAMIYGDDTDAWTGGEIVLFSARVEFQGKSMDGIRCRIPPRKPAAPETRAAPKSPTVDDRAPPPDFDDEIPF